MSERTDQLTEDAITQLLRTRSVDADLGLLDDIVRAVGAAPQDRPWLGLRPIRLTGRTLLIVAAALLLATMGAIGVGSQLLLPDPPESPVLGTWAIEFQGDGSTSTMVIRPTAGHDVEIEAHDTHSTLCSAPSTMTGAGTIESATQVLVPSPEFTCDDGSDWEDPLFEESLRNLTFIHDPATDLLIDSLSRRWERVGGPSQRPEPND